MVRKVWRADFRDGDGRRVKKDFSNAEDARRFETAGRRKALIGRLARVQARLQAAISQQQQAS